ncbi:coiled-coil domain-containing protein 93-like [Oppia nitens]|uniref:coiled-coil domain-containing protein 93-like n=1 Tax=Oppia nitens TaxID=1686743 RepID=UPI0023DCEBA9|nr:coiled-coil domain-containing protein 93-like [Oppia nitens]
MMDNKPVPATRSRVGPTSHCQTMDPSMAVIPDVREDEEQAVKMQEIINLLVAGGYFRARIKGLNNFDKVVGGMSWAIEMSNVDLDVDILFHESLTIGQKISLTEKIVSALHVMSCPHKIEPHQIQGMDCIHIFPVIQWLVKKSIETRQQMSDYLMSYAKWQFDRNHKLHDTDVTDANITSSSSANNIYKNPKRLYRHPARHKLIEAETRVRTTLLEYGSTAGKEMSTKTGTDRSSESESIEQNDSESQLRDQLMSSMLAETHKISAAFVGSIVGTQSDEIQKLAKEYHQKRLEREENSLEIMERKLRARVEATKRQLMTVKQNESEIIDKIQLCNERIEIVREKQQSIKPNEIQTDKEREEKQNLCYILDTLKKQKSEFKQFCREEKQRLDKHIEELSNQTTYDTEDETEVEVEVQSYEEKHQKSKSQLANLNKSIAKLQRKFDDIPTRAELSQYQKRFIELYNQVAAKHNETKKFYTLYNTLDDERMYLEKELNLIGSILDNFYQAQNSHNVREEFLLQFDQIVENIKQTKLKVENRRTIEKAKRDELNDTYLELIEKQRLYYKGVKDFKEECKTNERLISELENRKLRNNHV